MAYITVDEVKEIRNDLKTEFPSKDGWKFSVTREHSTSISVSIMKAPVRFTEKDHVQLNHYYLDRYENSQVLEKISSICNKKNFNKSDIMTDYHHVGFYFHFSVGKWNKPFELTR